MPKQVTHIFLKLSLKFKKKREEKQIQKLSIFKQWGTILYLYHCLFSLRLTVTLDHLSGNGMLRRIPFPILNIKHLVIRS